MSLMMKKFAKDKWPYLMAVLLCALLAVIHCIVRKVWIFGSNTLFQGDAGYQYIFYMSEIWNKLHNGNSIFYTWNAECGMDAYTNLLGYLVSPFHILVWMLPRKYLQDTVQFLMLFRWMMTSVSMVYYVMHSKRNKIVENKKLVAFFLGVAYACSSVMITNIVQFEWFDVFLVMPFLMLEFERLVDDGKWKLYCVLLTFTMLSNVYLAYAICIFLIIWFFNQKYGNRTVFIKRGLLFAVSSVCAAIISMIGLLPATIGLKSRYETGSSGGFEKARVSEYLCDFAGWVRGMYMFERGEDVYSTSPYLYVGIFAGIVFVAFLFSKIEWKQKVARCITAGLLISGFFVPQISFVWHAFTVPNGYYHRYTFLWSFFVLYMCMETLPYLKQIRVRYICCVAGLLACIFGIGFVLETDLREFYVYLATVLLFVFYLMMMILLRRKSITQGAFVKVCILVSVVELSVNAFVVFGTYNALLVENRYGNGVAEELLESASVGKGERVTQSLTDMDFGMWTDTGSISGFASASNGNLLKLLRMTGVSAYQSETGASYTGGSPVMNYMLNVSYGIAPSETYISDGTLVTEGEGLNLYKMNKTGSIGYMVNDTILDWSIESDQLFQIQNSYVEKATGLSGVLKSLPLDGVVQADYGTIKPDENNSFPVIMTTDSAGIMLTYEVPEDMDLYLYTSSTRTMDVFRYAKLDDELIYSEDDYRPAGTIHIGQVKKGQIVTFMEVVRDELGETVNFSYEFAAFDNEKYEAVYEKLSKNLMEVETFSDDYVKGNIDVKEDGVLMTSVVAKDGFSVYVDGEAVDYDIAGDVFIAVPLESGQHVVEIRYVTPYFEVGKMLSIGGILIFIILCFIEKKCGFWQNTRGDIVCG
jgi:uncharacterized membrane protein YfhO